ncbi:MAG: hypothetical protein Q9190_006239 [Brigantiaea leucoxantha]
MGWLWSSSRAPSQTETPTSKDESLPPSPPLVEELFNEPSPPTPDEQVDAEKTAADLRRILGYPEPNPDSTSNKLSRAQAAGIITPANLYPETISCSATFDQVFYCQSVGGQFMNIYRYGTFRDCRDLWRQFWFCVKTNRGFLGQEEKRDRIWDHYKSREMKYKTGPSSEDIWKPRARMVTGAFSRDLEADMKAQEEEMKRAADADLSALPE